MQRVGSKVRTIGVCLAVSGCCSREAPAASGLSCNRIWLRAALQAVIRAQALQTQPPPLQSMENAVGVATSVASTKDDLEMSKVRAPCRIGR